MTFLKSIFWGALAFLGGQSTLKQETTVSTPLNLTSAQIIRHVQLMRELKQRCFQKLPVESHSAKKADNDLSRKKYTQTEAYLSVYGDTINARWKNTLSKNAQLIERIIQKEKELADTHFVFYHAHNKELLIVQDFIKELNNYITIHNCRSDFRFMRFEELNAVYHTDMNGYIDSRIPIDDAKAEVSAEMLSVNFALFGNHTASGESSFHYFLNNISIQHSFLQNRLKPIFSYYGFDEKYIDQLVNLIDELDSSKGNLIQICIPKEDVDKLVYICKPFGIPYKKVICTEIYDTAKKRHTRIRPILDLYCTKPEAIEELHALQGRILFFPHLFDINSGIKFFNYHTIPQKNIENYQRKLNRIVTEIMQQYISDSPQQRFEPLFRLNHYMQRHPFLQNSI